MDFHKKLREYFKTLGINQKSIAMKINYSETMTGRYLNSNKPNYEFLLAIKREFPGIDFNYLFEDENTSYPLNEDNESYNSSEHIIDNIELELKKLRKVLAQNSHN